MDAVEQGVIRFQIGDGGKVSAALSPKCGLGDELSHVILEIAKALHIQTGVQKDAEPQAFHGEQRGKKYPETHQRSNQHQGQAAPPAHLEPALPEGCAQQYQTGDGIEQKPNDGGNTEQNARKGQIGQSTVDDTRHTPVPHFVYKQSVGHGENQRQIAQHDVERRQRQNRKAMPQHDGMQGNADAE